MRVLVASESWADVARWTSCLRSAAFAVDGAESLDATLAVMYEVPYDALVVSTSILVGVPLTRVTGAQATTAVVAVTGPGETAARAELLAAGVDDVTSAPVVRDEMVLRVARVLVRRSEPDGVPVVRVGGLEVDRLARSAWIDGVPLRLSVGAFCVLDHLVANRDRVLTPAELFDHCWDARVDAFSNPLPSQLNRIRRRLAGVAEVRWLPVGGYRLIATNSGPADPGGDLAPARRLGSDRGRAGS